MECNSRPGEVARQPGSGGHHAVESLLHGGTQYMKPAPFEYEAPESISEALQLLADHSDGAKVLAGGQSLLPLLNLRLSQPDLLVDIRKIKDGSRFDISDGTLRIGLGATQAEVLARRDLERFNPLLTQAVRLVGFPQTRARGTVLGSLAHADPAAELPAVMAILNAQLELLSLEGRRRVDASDFFLGPYTTALRSDELLFAVKLRALKPSEDALFVEVARHHGDFASAGLAALASHDHDGSLVNVKLIAIGAFPTPTRLLEAERVAVEEPAALRTAIFDTPGWSGGNLYTSSDLLRHQVAVLAERSLARLATRSISGLSVP